MKKKIAICDFSHDKPYSNSINTELKKIGNKNIIVLRKLLGKNDLFDVIINAGVVIFPSEVEAMSMFDLEALACQTLLVCSDIESNIKVVGEKYKYLFESKNVDALSKAIHTALGDLYIEKSVTDVLTVPDLYEKYNWEKIAKKYNHIYESFFPAHSNDLICCTQQTNENHDITA